MLANRRKPGHCVSSGWEKAGGFSSDVLEAESQEPEDRAAKLKSWSVSELAYFLAKKDMDGPAQHLRAQGASGADFAAMTEQMLQQELRLSIFTARKLVHVREAHLAQA